MVFNICHAQTIFELKEFFDQTDAAVAVLLPSPGDVIKLQELINHLEKFESVTKRLQREDTDISVVRTLFDKLLENYHEMEHFLGRSNGSLTHYPNFEIGLINAICGLPLSSQQDSAVIDIANTFQTDECEEAKGRSDYAESVLQAKRIKTSTNFKWVPVTSNVAERLFSRAKFTIRDNRKKFYLFILKCCYSCS